MSAVHVPPRPQQMARVWVESSGPRVRRPGSSTRCAACPGASPCHSQGSGFFVSCCRGTGRLSSSTKLTTLMIHTAQPSAAIPGIRLRHRTGVPGPKEARPTNPDFPVRPPFPQGPPPSQATWCNAELEWGDVARRGLGRFSQNQQSLGCLQFLLPL